MGLMKKTSAALLFSLVVSGTAIAEDLWMTLPETPAMPTATQSGLAPVNDIQMYYAIYGEGPPLLLLHGGLGHSDVWGNQIAALAEHFTVITADSRGHGRSTRSEQPFGYHLMATDVVALMDYLKIDKASILGWSDGGIIGLDIAMTAPERLDRLFAFGANTQVAGLRSDIGDSVTFTAYIERMAGDYARLSPTPDQFDAFVGQIGEMWATQPDYKAEQLATITARVAIADGQYDEAILQSHNEEMAAQVPGAQLVILPSVSHFAFWQDPALFNKAVLDFLLAP